MGLGNSTVSPFQVGIGDGGLVPNRAIKRAVKTYCKRVLAAAAGGNLELLRQEFALAMKKLDKAAAQRVIHRNLAARRKSQLARLVNETVAKAQQTPPPASS